ncbi:MAG: cytochrome c oxidase subunit 2 [Cognaticolwellia sp.]|jgi:cytochrome c oxidase subunit 2
MTALVIILTVVLAIVVTVQIGRLSELAAKIRGEQESEADSNKRNAYGMIVFMVLFLLLTIGSSIYYKNSILWYGPHVSASEHGSALDRTFNVTLFFTGIVFVLTQILLFWYAYKYRKQQGKKALFISHDNRLEVIWTAIPAVVMTFLVVSGLDTWNTAMADISPSEVAGKDYIEIEATGMQFAWLLRHPGKDNLLGTRNYQLIDGTNQLGQDWTDEKNLDDIMPDRIVLPVGKKVRVRITSRDVLHNFDLPHFRVKMDAVPGMPTYFVFTPTVTTEQYRKNLGELDKDGEPMYPEWHTPSDPEDPTSAPRWKEFVYELACAELCGNGHYSMRRIVEVVSQEEYDRWLAEQTPYYESSIKKADPVISEEEVITEVEMLTENDAAVTEEVDAGVRN